MSKAEWENNKEIKIFREYLQIPSVHPNVDYSKNFFIIKQSLSAIKIKVNTFNSALCGFLKKTGS